MNLEPERLSRKHFIAVIEYFLKIESGFSGWCKAQELLDKGKTPSMLKVYVAAIAAFTKPVTGKERSGYLLS